MRIVMTAATAGLGLVAAASLVATGQPLTIGARAHDKLPPVISGRVRAEPLDLASLARVHVFTNAVDNKTIDVLLLIAGLQLARPAKSTDGLERTFAVNRLAHYLLLRLLVEKVRPGDRIMLSRAICDGV